MNHKKILENIGYQFDDDLYTKENADITWKDVHEIMDAVSKDNSVLQSIIGHTFYALMSPNDKLIDGFWIEDEAMKKLDHYEHNVGSGYYVKVLDKTV